MEVPDAGALLTLGTGVAIDEQQVRKTADLDPAEFVGLSHAVAACSASAGVSPHRPVGALSSPSVPAAGFR